MKRKRPVIAIDGPVGTGKSTVARELARELGFRYVNTGALYRAVAIAAREENIQPDDAQVERRLGDLLGRIEIRMEGERMLVDGRDITAALSEHDIGDLASRLSALRVVRERMLDIQRALGHEGGVVIEGRDIGTVVFPDAELKFYLTATTEVRADRRYKELAAKGAEVTREQVLAQLVERDSRDQKRELAPLRRADDAIVIDSSHVTVSQVVTQIKSHIKRSESELDRT